MYSDNVVSVHIGEASVTSEPSTLAVHGLGSCVALILFDRIRKTGGLAHVLLPGPRPGGRTDSELPAKYGDEALDWMLTRFTELGSDIGYLSAALVGGARLFTAEQEVDHGIGPRNVNCIRSAVLDKGIPILAEEVGGGIGRSVYFTLPSCILEVKTLREGKRKIKMKG